MTGGRISEEIVQSCKDFLDFTTCERPDGSLYGTGGRCRKGVEAEKPSEEKVGQVKAALEMGIDEFVQKYGHRRQALLDYFADSFAEKAAIDGGVNLGTADQIRLTAAEQGERAIARYHLLTDTKDTEKTKAAASILAAKELFDGIKSRLVNEHMFISEGALKLLWEGKDPEQKALTGLTPEEIERGGGPGKFGISRMIVDEHPYPTKTLKDNLMNDLPRGSSAVEVAKFALKRNFYSWTGALDDVKLTASGLKSKMPDENNRFSRYDSSGIKVFTLKVPEKARPDAGFVKKKWIVDSVKQAKDSGASYEEWVASVIDL